MTLVRLHPAPVGPTTVAAEYATPRPAVDGRPWVGVCMIASIDGATAVEGRSGGLGNATDRAVLRTLRATADVVLVGAGTAAGEGYGPPSRPGLRVAVVTNSGRIDPDRALFAEGAGFVIAPRNAPVPDGVDVLRAGDDAVDLAAALAELPGVVPGARFVTAEGGPRLNGALLAAGLVDELSVTISPELTGGASARLVAGAPEVRAGFDLAHVLLDDDHFVFTRWIRRGAVPVVG